MNALYSAVEFLLRDRVRHGDRPSQQKAREHLEAVEVEASVMQAFDTSDLEGAADDLEGVMVTREGVQDKEAIAEAVAAQDAEATERGLMGRVGDLLQGKS